MVQQQEEDEEGQQKVIPRAYEALRQVLCIIMSACVGRLNICRAHATVQPHACVHALH